MSATSMRMEKFQCFGFACMLEVPWYMSFNEGYLFYVTGETYEPIKTDKGDSISKLFVILIVMCMAIIACTVIFLVNRRQKNIKEETDNE